MRNCDHQLIWSYEERQLWVALPENNCVIAEIAAVDRHSERHAVDWHTVRRQGRYRGNNQRGYFERIVISGFSGVSASKREQSYQQKTEVPHNYLRQVQKNALMGAQRQQTVPLKGRCQDERICTAAGFCSTGRLPFVAFMVSHKLIAKC